MKITLDRDILLRDLEFTDAHALARHADNPRIAAHLRDLFPSPYSEDDALAFIAKIRGESIPSAFTIEVDGEACGVVGYVAGQDVYRHSAEVGYWLSEEYWGRWIMTRVITAFSAWMFETHEFRRLFAGVFSSNSASARVLEKAGYVREGVMRDHVTKDGEVMDEWHYALVKSGKKYNEI